MGSQDVGYLMKKTLLYSTKSEFDAPFDNLVWILTIVSIIIATFALFGISKMRFVLNKISY